MSGEYRDFVMELVGPLGPVSARGMFGGTGIFYDILMFALIIDDRLYFKADERNRPDYEDEGMEPFTYVSRNGRRAVMSYWEVPERLFDEPEEMRLWGEKAVAAAIAAARKKASAAKKAPRSRAAARPKPAGRRPGA